MSEKKLRLHKETIRNLSDESLEQVAGGKHKGETLLGFCNNSNVKKSACVACQSVGICQSGILC